MAEQTLCYELRAAFCLWESGDRGRAAEYLEKMRGFDWKAARLWANRRDSDRAYTYLLLTQAISGDRHGFIKLFEEAVENGKALDNPFSSVLPNQKKLITACIEMNYAEGLKTVLDNIQPDHAAEDAELQILVAQGRRHVEGAGATDKKWWQFWK